MRIGVDAGRALHGYGGVASYSRQLANALARHAPEHQLVIFDLDRGIHRREVFEKRLGPLPSNVQTAQASEFELARLDLFHAPGFVLPPPGAPHHVVTLHDLTVLSHPEYHTLENRVRTMVAVAGALTRGATIIAVSRATRAEAVRLLSMSGESLEVLPPMLDPRFNPAGNDELDEAALHKLGVDAPFCLAVGSLEPRKNLGRLLDAWELLPAGVRDEHLLVVVASAGWLHREGFGLPVAEAMACGAPVVTSDVSSMPEVAGRAAVLVDPEDADAIADGVARVLERTELRRDLRERGPEQALQFSAEAVVPRLLEIYQRTVES